MVGKRHHQDTLPQCNLLPLRRLLRARIWNTGLVVICPQKELQGWVHLHIDEAASAAWAGGAHTKAFYRQSCSNTGRRVSLMNSMANPMSRFLDSFNGFVRDEIGEIAGEGRSNNNYEPSLAMGLVPDSYTYGEIAETAHTPEPRPSQANARCNQDAGIRVDWPGVGSV